MKTKWHLYIFWSLLLIGLLSCAADTYEFPFTERKRLFQLGASKSGPIKKSRSGDTKSPQRSAAARPQIRSHGPHPTLGPGSPRSMRPAETRSGFAFLPDVSVTCSSSDFVVRVKPSFYGLGADAQELRLGGSCRSNGVLRPYGDLLFTYPLTACDAERQAPRGYLVYRFVLHYEPSPKRFPSRSHRLDVDIECRYQRNHHVYQLAVKPTWQTAVVRKRLRGGPSDFQIQLMDDSWSRPAKSQEYQLGQTVNVQVSAPRLPSGGKLYIRNCYATPTSGSLSSFKYPIIDNLGCMVDSKRALGASKFIYRTDKMLRFSLMAFQFIADPDTEVSIHCKLSITSEEPSPAHKSCTYRENRWRALTGDDSICECCDSQCVTSKTQMAMMEGSARSKSLLVSDQPYMGEDGLLPASPSLVSMGGEAKTTVSHHFDELLIQEPLWESSDADYDYEEEEEEADYTEEKLDEGEAQSSVIFEVVTDEGKLEKLVLSHGISVEERKEPGAKDSNGFGLDGSGHEAEDLLEGVEEEGESEEREEEFSVPQEVTHLNQEEGEVLRHWAQLRQLKTSLQKEAQLPDSEEEIRKYRNVSEEDERTATFEDVEWKNEDTLANVADDREMTWYFTWR